MLGRKGNNEKGRKQGRGRAAAQGKAQPSPAPSRNANLLASHVHETLGQILDEEVESFRGREGKTRPKTCAVVFGNCADIDQKKMPRKEEIC